MNKKRMETTDEEITAGALDLIERQQKAGEHQLDPPAAVLSYTTKTFSAFNCWQARVIVRTIPRMARTAGVLASR